MKTVFSWARSLHFMVAKRDVSSMAHFVELARVGPEVGSSSLPFVTWHSLITTRLLASSSSSSSSSGSGLPSADASASARKKAKKLKAAAAASAAAALSGSKGLRVFPGTALKQFALELCSSVVFEGSNRCKGVGICPFSHDKPAAGSVIAGKLHALSVAFPELKCRPGFKF